MWLTLQYHSFLSVQKTGITFKRTAHTICLCTLLMQCFSKYTVDISKVDNTQLGLVDRYLHGRYSVESTQ